MAIKLAKNLRDKNICRIFAPRKFNQSVRATRHKIGAEVMANTTKCYCLRTKDGGLHCPLSTDRSLLERTFNAFVRGEEIVDVEIDNSFVCNKERKSYCENCPFNK